MDFITFIGVFGAFLLLVAFIENEYKKFKTNSLAYDLLNLIGAGLLTIYAYLLGSVPFLILEGIWALVALKDVVRRLTKYPR